MTQTDAPSARRSYAGPVILSIGFRPFFLVAGLWSAGSMMIWLAIVAGILDLPGDLDPVSWHAHEMLFGYVVAVIAGFALTAVPNWTGRLPVRGMPLAQLLLLWLLGRLAVACSWFLPIAVVAVTDIAFLFALTALFVREIYAGRNWRNLPIAAVFGLLTIANGVSYLPAFYAGVDSVFAYRLALATIMILITLIGGRIVPSFTRNWLVKNGSDLRPAAFNRVDQMAILAVVIAVLSWAALPEHGFTGFLLLISSAIGAIRLSRWCSLGTLSEALVWSLHLGYAWLVFGLGLLGLSVLLASLPASAAVHALTAGAIGIMTLAVMTRATLGHTGRELAATPATIVIYVAATLSAFARVASGLGLMDGIPLLELSGTLWIFTFLLFAAVYGPMLLGKRSS